MFSHRTADALAKQVPQHLFGPVQYNFSFGIDVNGVRSQADGLYMTVDGDGNITSYNRTAAGASYPSAKPAISYEKAGQIYHTAVDLPLQYMPVYNSAFTSKTWKLAWAPVRMADTSIEAQTGDFLDSMGNKVERCRGSRRR